MHQTVWTDDTHIYTQWVQFVCTGGVEKKRKQRNDMWLECRQMINSWYA